MSQLPPETRALHETIIVGLLAFFIGMAGTLVLIGWLMWRFVEADTPWYALLHMSINGLLISVVGGMVTAIVAMWLLDKLHYLRGMYRCPYCNRRLKGVMAFCDCPQAQVLRPTPR